VVSARRWHSYGEDHFVVRSPALLGLVACWVQVGVPAGEALGLVEVLTSDLGALAETPAGLIVDQIWSPVSAAGRAAELPDLLRCARPLLLRGVASTLADRLGAALTERAGSRPRLRTSAWVRSRTRRARSTGEETSR
jgi:hypothetical protein